MVVFWRVFVSKLATADYLNYWDKDDIFIYDYEFALGLGIKTSDARFLSEVGIPMWCAPHIMLDLSDAKDDGEGFLKIGEWEDGEDIVYEKSSGRLFVIFDGVPKFISNSIENLAKLLIVYAQMIEDAININGKDASINDLIPGQVLDDAENKMKAIIGEDDLWINSVFYAHLKDRKKRSRSK
jgi:hypothetical protein